MIFLAVAGIVVTQAQQGESERRPPQLTTDDLRSAASRGAYNRSSESGVRPGPDNQLRNARAVLEGIFNRIRKVSSLRMDIVRSGPYGDEQVTIEAVKPDRFRMKSPRLEMVVIGPDCYFRRGGDRWQIMSSKTILRDEDPRTFLSDLCVIGQASISGRTIGDAAVNGFETTVHEFLLSYKAGDRVTMQAYIEKRDAYLRKLSILGNHRQIQIWFNNLDEEFEIDPPV